MRSAAKGADRGQIETAAARYAQRRQSKRARLGVQRLLFEILVVQAQQRAAYAQVRERGNQAEDDVLGAIQAGARTDVKHVQVSVHWLDRCRQDRGKDVRTPPPSP